MDKTQLDSGPGPRGLTDRRTELRRIGDYRILRRLGEGGMGAVYLGYSENEDLQVAIKVLGDQLADDQAYIDRFYREAKSGALLNHPNIVRSLIAGQDGASGKHYLVLEYVDGPSAQALLNRQSPLPVGDAVHIILDVARGLEHAHSRNLIHRDIKPDNILLTLAGVAKLVDLGLAKRLDEASHLTGTRQTFGTTPYMPFEQALRAKSADGRSDIYALGATLYHLVTGTVPFPADSHLEVVEKKDRGEYAPASSLNPDVPAVLDRILARMLARQPRERYQTVSEVLVDLQRSGLSADVPSFIHPHPWRRDTGFNGRLADKPAPTRIDPESPIRRSADYWELRYRNHAGQLRRARATTAQIVARLQTARLPSGIEVRRMTMKDFHPPAHFPEFQTSVRSAYLRKKLPRLPSQPTREQGPVAAGGAQTFAPNRVPLWLLAGAGAATVGVAIGLLALLYKFV